MHPQHPQSDGDGLASQFMDLVQRRARRAATAARWAERSAEIAAELQAENQLLIKAHAEQHEEIVLLRRLVTRRLGLNVPPPPEIYIQALRAEQLEPYREITVDIDGLPWIIELSCHPKTGPDPLRELLTWQQNVATAREVRSSLAEGA